MCADKMKRRILFVDDEANILMGLQRMLRKMRNEWEMTFVQSGAEALKELEAKTFEVVITDMRMPGMDGAELLSLIQRRYPQMVRIIFSGHSEQKMILKSVRYAHQYLSKPCESDILITTVKRSCALHDLLLQKSLKAIISQTESLPSLPALYSELMEELRSPDGSVQRVGEIIAQDLAMTAKVLQLVNSSFFGLPRQVADPSQAVILLGCDTIKALVLTVGVFATFETSALCATKIEQIYAHCLRVGALTRAITWQETGDRQLSDSAFTAGLLHDLGKLLLSAQFPKRYQEVFTLAHQDQIPFWEAEKKKIGATHGQVGAYLLGLWGLAESTVESVAYHDAPWELEHDAFCPLTAVYAANIIDHRNGFAVDQDAVEYAFNTDYLERLGCAGRVAAWEELAREMDGREEE